MRDTREADPFWCDRDSIPYEKMWADDALWIPDMLAGRKRTGWFIFDGDSMIDHKVVDGIEDDQ